MLMIRVRRIANGRPRKALYRGIGLFLTKRIKEGRLLVVVDRGQNPRCDLLIIEGQQYINEVFRMYDEQLGVTPILTTYSYLRHDP